MTDTHPTLPALIQNKLSDAMKLITEHVKTFHVDGEVSCAGYLRNGKGAKILISNLEEMHDDDIQTWIHHCKVSGAIGVNYTADFGTGTITLDVEYKKPSTPINYCEWLKYPLILAALATALQIL